MYRQFAQPGFQPIPGQTWFPPPQPMPTPVPTPVPPAQPMTFEEMYMILAEMYEMIKCIYEQEIDD
ncbi:MAG: hypothetical protein GXW85_07125 [Clostridia bacterium]|nr:hypothetical protein [Clostridia bacterium]